jgi:uncharacterized protein (DUF58 family)
VQGGRAPIPLLPRRRVHGTPLGDMRSARRGDGAELVGLRPYRTGDDLRRIDHRASARLSRARGDETLLVREFHAEEAARVVVVLDTSPSMQLYPPELPWLQKPAAVERVVRLLLDSAAEARSAVGCLRTDAAGDVAWSPPARRPPAAEWLESATDGDGRSLVRSLGALARLPRLGKGTFVFVVSDFVDPPGEDVWWPLLARGWDPVPVVVQDPTWEQSFPALGGRAVAVACADGSRSRLVRLSRAEAESLREAHETRLRTTLDRLRALTLEPVLVGSHEPLDVHLAFHLWSAGRGGRLR